MHNFLVLSSRVLKASRRKLSDSLWKTSLCLNLVFFVVIDIQNLLTRPFGESCLLGYS